MSRREDCPQYTSSVPIHAQKHEAGGHCAAVDELIRGAKFDEMGSGGGGGDGGRLRCVGGVQGHRLSGDDGVSSSELHDSLHSLPLLHSQPSTAAPSELAFPKCDGEMMSDGGAAAEFCPSQHAYLDERWLAGVSAARPVRLMCEYLETQSRLRLQQVFLSVVFFGSARVKSRNEWEKEWILLSETLEDPWLSSCLREDLLEKQERLKRVEPFCEYWDKTRELAKMISEWSQTTEGRDTTSRILKSVPLEGALDDNAKQSPLIVCTGGGPGFMEAANYGAWQAGARSGGMGINLPFEVGLNKWVTPSLAFMFRYFFMRKFWMVYTAVGLVCSPGGLGTLDELMEVITLKQTGRIKRSVPIVLLGKAFWKSVVNFDSLIESGMMGRNDLSSVLYTDDVEEAFKHICNGIRQ